MITKANSSNFRAQAWSTRAKVKPVRLSKFIFAVIARALPLGAAFGLSQTAADGSLSIYDLLILARSLTSPFCISMV